MIGDAPRPGALVVVFLHSPKERVWGVLRGIDPAGAWIEGIDLDSFEDWARQVGRRDEPAMGLSVAFYPLLRLEKLLLDRGAPGQPSFSDRFSGLAGLTVEEYLGLGPEEARP